MVTAFVDQGLDEKKYVNQTQTLTAADHSVVTLCQDLVISVTASTPCRKLHCHPTELVKERIVVKECHCA